MPKWTEAVIGAALLVGTILTGGLMSPALFAFLVSASTGLVLSGIGTLLSKGPLSGYATATRNPIAPWHAVYGEHRVGGTVIYINSFGDADKYLDLVMVLAAHPCEAVDYVLFDQQRLLMFPSGTGFGQMTFSPVQQVVNISSIARTNNVVTVRLSGDIPLLQEGDQLIIKGVHPVNDLFNGRFQIHIIDRIGGNLTFTYLAGGPVASLSGIGQAHTVWPDYRKKVYMEALLGDQILGQTFVGMLNGTPYDGDVGNLVQPSDPNPWTADCSCVGKTIVFLRLHYNDEVFSGGLPQISFQMRGNNNIRDPRTSPPTFGYTNNAALCIADYLANTKYGFKAVYGTEIPDAELIAAANICDEQVPLAEPVVSPPLTESRYTCNGGFDLSSKRGDILQNLLTSCAGRLTYAGGQFVIWPAAWPGVALTLAGGFFEANSTAPFRWRPKVTITELYNGVKGTYISQVNSWQSSDFPRYAQDLQHGYNNGTPQNDYDANLDEDLGDRRWLDIQLPFTISCPTAQRIAKIELMRRRQQGTGTFRLNMVGYQFAALDVLAVTLNYFGWAGKYLEVAAVRFIQSRQQSGGVEVPALGTEIDVQETDPSVYFWSVGEELSPAGYQQVIVPDTKTPAPPTHLKLTFQNGDIVLAWTAPADAFVLKGGHIEGRYQVIASPEGLWVQLARMDPSVTSLVLPSLLDNLLFTVQLRSVNAAGVPSVWVGVDYSPNSAPPQWNPHEVQADPADALYPGEYTFELEESYADLTGTPSVLTEGVNQVRINVTGAEPVNDLVVCAPPQIGIENVIVSPTGGHIPGGVMVYVAIGANDSNNKPGPRSAIVAVSIPVGTNTNKITIGGPTARITGFFDSNPVTGDQVLVAGKMYTFQQVLTNVDGNVATGPTLFHTLQNFLNAINLGPGSGTAYASAMTANANASAISNDATSILCQSLLAGVAGNALTASGSARWSNLGFFFGGGVLDWSDISGLFGWTIYAGLQADLMCAQKTGTFTITTPPYSPASVTLDVALARSSLGLPDEHIQVMRAKGKLLYHGGVLGALIDSAIDNETSPPTSPPSFLGSITSKQCIDASGVGSPPVFDDWSGRVLAIIGRSVGPVPFEAYNITAFDHATGTFTLDRPLGDVQPGDVFVVCTLGVDNSLTPKHISDPGLSNAQNYNLATLQSTPHSGLTPNLEVGLVLRVIKGKSRGMKANIVANQATGYDLDAEIPIDATSVWIVEEPGWPYTIDLTPIDNANPLQVATLAMPVNNFLKQSMLVGGFLVDDQANESEDGDGPFRMIYIWAAALGGKPPAEWAPFKVQADPADAVFPNEYNFRFIERFGFAMASGEGSSELVSDGFQAINSPNGVDQGCPAPEIGSAVVVTGGSIDGGTSGFKLHIQICAAVGAHGEGGITPPSDIVTVDIPSGTGWQVQLDNIVWPNFNTGGPFDHYIIFASPQVDLICEQQSGALTGNAASPPPATYAPTNVSLSNALQRSTWSVPVNVVQVRIAGYSLVHGGVIGAQVDSLDQSSPPTSPPTVFGVISQETIDLGTSPPTSPPSGADNWNGRVLGIIGRRGDYVPFAFYNIVSYDPTTGIFVLDRTNDIQAGDVFVVCTKGVDNSGNPLVVTDTGLANASNYEVTSGQIVPTPHSGLSPNTEVGRVLHVIAGTGRGQYATIVANDATSYTLATPILIDATSIWIIRSATPAFITDSPRTLANKLYNSAVTIETPDTFGAQAFILFGVNLDPAGNPALLPDAPSRMVYVWGGGSGGGAAAGVLTEVGHIIFGIDDDTLAQGPNSDGINVIEKYGNIHETGQPFVGSISCNGLPLHADSIWDVQYSRDGGITWNSIFPLGPPGNPWKYKIRFTQAPSPPPAGGARQNWNVFAPVVLDRTTDIVRLNVLQSGGATGITIVVKLGAPGSKN